MSSVKKLKELIFECDTEQEAMDLLKNYRKKNFHLVSKKLTSSSDTTLAIKLIKFRQSSTGVDLETVWEDFVKQMSSFGVSNSLVVEVLQRIRLKDKFWEIHPEDHLRDILMDARNFVKYESLAKVLVFIAPESQGIDFFVAYQKTLNAMINSLGVFVMAPERLKSRIKELKSSAQVQSISYNSQSKISDYKKDIDSKIGIILVTPADLNFLTDKNLSQEIEAKRVSLIGSSLIDSKEIKEISGSLMFAGHYSNVKKGTEIFTTLFQSLKHQKPIAFLWNAETLGTILNPESQVLKVIDDLFEKKVAQHLSNE